MKKKNLSQGTEKAPDSKNEPRARTQARFQGQGRSQLQGRGSSEHYKDQNGHSAKKTSPYKK